jgi:hypothetical protein
VRRRIRLRPAIFVLFSASLLQCQESATEPEANPGRPTVSTPATLTPIKYLQFETGSLTARHSPEFSSRIGFNEVIKLTVHKRVQFLAAVEPLSHYWTENQGASATGEVFLGAQAMLHAGEGPNPTISAGYFRRVYNGGGPDIDLGSPRDSFILLASADVRGFHYDANALFNEMSETDVRHLQLGQTLSVSHSIGNRFSLSGEIWHFTQPFLRGHAAGNLWALAYSARKNLVLDVGFNRGLTSTSTRWEVFAGFTYVLPHRLWR